MIAGEALADSAAVEPAFRIERPISSWLIGSYFVGLRIADHIVNLMLSCIGSNRIIQRASIKWTYASSSILESPENIPGK
jgi:hypothetical protein